MPHVSHRRLGSADGPGKSSYTDRILFGMLIVPIIGGALFLGYESSVTTQICPAPPTIVAVVYWFDPLFLQYNLILATIAITIVPSIPFLYVHAMAWRKRERLYREVPDSAKDHIDFRMLIRSKFRFYFGSTVLTTAIAALGVSILLMFKPVWGAEHCGVDFKTGVNMLVAGPYFNLFGGPATENAVEFYSHILNALVGFQFGFLGAYIYFLIALIRAYFMLDLTPGTMVDGAVRIGVASVLSLVLSFGFAGTTGHWLLSADHLPIVSFFCGFFPDRALTVLEQWASTLVKLVPGSKPQWIPLSALHGMSYMHQARLAREGFDNAENLSHADPVDLAVRTGFSYRQLREWVSEACLACHLREDYAAFVQRTGIASAEDLARYFLAVPGTLSVHTLLPGSDTEKATKLLRDKVAVLRALLP